MKILQIAHSHPMFHAGGTEMVAMGLHREALKVGHDSFFLGAADATQRNSNPGTNFLAISEDGRENVVWFPTFDRFDLQQHDSFGGLREFRAFLETIRPDVIHVHHFLNFGLEAFFVMRDTIPKARIILTLHDYYSICPSNGQLFRYHDATRCDGPSLIKCKQCFPKRDPIAFKLRSLAIRNAINLCDIVASPSHFLKRLVEPHLRLRQPIEVVENGYMGEHNALLPRQERVGPVRFGYFGNISEVKGLRSLLEAVELLSREGVSNFHVHVHGQQLFEDKVLSEAIAHAKQKHLNIITFCGGYNANEIASRMAAVDAVIFPSIWWENAPLVIYEALSMQRQVLCYPHSAAVEILNKNGVGIIASETTSIALANSMKRLIDNPDLTKLSEKPMVRNTQDVFADYQTLYGSAL
jgi:glycosyltransferase involved in cell wall biosynthesis